MMILTGTLCYIEDYYDGTDGLSWLKSAPLFCPLLKYLCSVWILKEIILGDYLLSFSLQLLQVKKGMNAEEKICTVSALYCHRMVSSGTNMLKVCWCLWTALTKFLQPGFMLKGYFKDHRMWWNRYLSVFLMMYFPSYILKSWERIIF